MNQAIRALAEGIVARESRTRDNVKYIIYG